MLRFLCPSCQSSLQVPESTAGKKGSCPRCGQRLQVPMPPRNRTVLGVLPDATTSYATPSLPTPTASPPPLAEYAPPARLPQGTKLGCVALTIVLIAVGALGVSVLTFAPRQDSAKTTDLHPASTDAEAAQTVQHVGTAGLRVGGCLIWVIASFMYFLFWILCLVWVARDAKNRSIDGGAMWVIIIFFTHFLGLLVYIAARPSGSLTTCGWCQNRKLNYARLCPHCGQNAS